jgi:hypothetical protein
MRTRKIRAAIGLGLAAVLIAVMGALNFFSTEPHYQARPLSLWLSELHESDAAQQQKAREALLDIGDNATRCLIKWLDEKDSLLRKEIFKPITGFSRIKNRMTANEMRRANAASALGLIGPSAAAAVPSLVRATHDDSWIVATRAKAALIQIRQEPDAALGAGLADMSNLTNWLTAASTLAALGSNLAPNIAAFLKALPERSLGTRFDLVQLLCTRHMEASVAIPIVVGCLNDQEPGVRVNTMNAVIINAQWLDESSAHKKWLRELQAVAARALLDTNRSVRLNSLFFLMFTMQNEKLGTTISNLQPALVQLSNDPDPGIRSTAAAIQARISK